MSLVPKLSPNDNRFLHSMLQVFKTSYADFYNQFRFDKILTFCTNIKSNIDLLIPPKIL